MGDQKIWNDRLIQAVLPSFMKNIPEEKRELFTQRYQEKVFMKYLAQLALCGSDKEREEKIMSIAQEETEQWGKASYDEKLHYLVPDPYLEKLLDLSKEILQKAQKCVKEGMIARDGQYDKKREDLQTYFEHVLPAHKHRAKEVLEDALIDLNVAYDRADSNRMRGFGML